MQQRSRRRFLVDLGRTSAGLVVVGAGAVACSSDDPVVASAPSTPTGGAAVRPSAPSTPGTAEPPSTAPTAETAVGGFAVSQVDLGFVAAYVLARDGEAVLVDTGVAGSAGDILAVLEGLGLGWGSLAHVILTHQHNDHAGSIGAVADAAMAAVLHAGDADIPGITAPREVLAVADGDTVMDLRILATPGHTPGHISVFDPAGGGLVVGDAMNGVDGELVGANPRFTPDMAAADDSVRYLAQAVEPTAFYVGHGFPLRAGAAQLQALAASL